MQRLCNGYVDAMPLTLYGANQFCINGINVVFARRKPLLKKICRGCVLHKRHKSRINAFYAKAMQRLLQSHGRQMEPVFFLVVVFSVVNTKPGRLVSE